MKRRFTLVVVVLLLALALTATALAQGGLGDPIPPDSPPPSADTGAFVNETGNLWFVEFESQPAVRGGNRSAIAAERANFKAAAADAGVDYAVRFEFDTLWNGISVAASPEAAAEISVLPGVAAVYPVEVIAAPDPAFSPDLASALAMTGADVAQSELGFTGAGVRVAVMDTGIDYDHPDLGGCFGPGCRVETGYDFVGDAYNADDTADSYNPVPSPDPDPDDCHGHGSHVAGIVGASGDFAAGGVRGVAPGVTFGAYRVFGCEGSTTADIMIQAMERALADDMDVLNMSIGSAFTWPQYPTAVAADNLVDAGMVVVASTGNSGSYGTFSAGAPGLGEKVIATASYDNTMVLLQLANVDGPNNDFPIGVAPMSGSGEIPVGRTDEVVYVGRGCPVSPAYGIEVEDPYEADPAGKAALIARGGCSFAEKTQRAVDAGAVSVLIHNSSAGRFSGTLGSYASPVAAVSISLSEGLAMRDEIAAGTTTLTWTDEQDAFPNPTAGLISSFSSYGLSPDLALKPDIGAPGGSINSTYPLEKGGYATISGTSMASPHVAGAAALYLEAHPGTPAHLVRDIFQNSADPAPWSLSAGSGFLDSVHRQGAGMVDIDDSILATTLITPGKLSAGEGEAGPFNATLNVANNSGADVTYNLSVWDNTIATYGTFAEELGYYYFPPTVSLPESITVPAGGSAQVPVTIEAAVVGAPVQYGGYIVFTDDASGAVFSVPFGGVTDDYQMLTVLEPNPDGLPWLAKRTGPGATDFEMQEEGAVFTMQDGDIPYFLFHLHHQSQYMDIKAYDAATGEPVHPNFSTIFEDEYLPRNAESGGFAYVGWDGTRMHSQGNKNMRMSLPNGDYFVELRVLKALGDPGNPDHWESWTSPVFTIENPDNPGQSRGPSGQGNK